MPLILAGIDEAGYGPTLGPLCVALSAFRIEDWNEGDPAPDLWSRLSGGVCREAREAPGRVAVADSKLLKLANSGVTRHPLHHLERGVLAFAPQAEPLPAGLTDAALFDRLGASLRGHACYAGDPAPLPLAWTPEQVAIAANVVGRACSAAGVTVLAMACETLAEPAFNEIVRRTRSKAEATLHAIARHLALVRARFPAPAQDRVRIVCDRLGGRTAYAGVLARLVPGAEIRTLEESDRRSRYAVHDAAGEFGVCFQTEGEAAHLPVALASMIAKYVRELAMARFNRHWCALMPELKPTAGYAQDARRWLRDAAPGLTPADRAAIVRIA